MKVLTKVTTRDMLSRRRNCKVCLGKGYVLYIRPDLDATKFREVVPCQCVRQVVRVEEDY